MSRSLSKDDLSTLKALQDELHRRYRIKAFQNYKPTNVQLPVHEAMKSHTITLMLGGNGIGKTDTEVAACLSYVLGYRPWDGSTTRVPPNRVLLVGPDLTNYVAQAAAPRIFKYMPEEMWTRIERTTMGVPHILHHMNGSTVTLMSYEQHIRKGPDLASPFEGIDFDFAGFDEPCPRDVFIAVHRGVSKRGGKMLMCLTPLAEPWIYDELYQKEDKNIAKFCIDVRDTVRTKENPDGTWDKDALQIFMDSIRGDDQEDARISGVFKHLVGRVFPEYEPTVHRFHPSKITIQPSWPKGLTIDPHDRKPFMMTWWAVNPDGQIIFFKEWPTDPFHKWKSCDTTWDEYADFIKAEEARIPGGPDSVRYRYIDPSSGAAQKAAVGETLVDFFAKQGLYFDHEVDNGIPRGHAALHRLLAYDKNKPLSFSNRPSLLISEDCWNLHYAMTHYLWDDRTVSSSTHEKVREDGKDAMDVMRYTAIKKPLYFNALDAPKPMVDISRMAHSGLG